MDAGLRPDRLRALSSKVFSFLMQPLWGAIFALTLGLLTFALLEFAPGVPGRFRPYTHYKHWRADGFVVQAAQAQERGELDVAHLALSSALTLNPKLSSAHIQLARLQVTEGRFADAARQAELIGMDGPGFVHDMLFYTGRFNELLAYCAIRATHSSNRQAVWLQSALMIAPLAAPETRAQVVQSLIGSNLASARLLEAILLATDKRGEEAAGKLTERAKLPGLDAAETLLGVELLMQAGDPARAWVWLQRHRELLTDFDARCGDYRIESSRDPVLARSILKSFTQLSMNESRWVRLGSVVAISGDSDAANLFCQLLADSHPHPSAALSASAWALLLLHARNNEALTWERNYRRAGGTELPVLAGRKLSEADHKARSQAVRLLSSSSPLPREMISALLLR